MFLVNFLNREKTDPFFPLFEIIYVIELVVVLVAIVLGIALILPACRMRYHLNVRMRVVFSLLQGIIYPATRIVVISHQYFGPADQVEYTHIIVCGQIKQAFLGYFTALYERAGYGTILFLIAQEIVLITVGNLEGASLILFELITDIQSTIYFAIVLPIGTTIFIATYRFNRREMINMKRGAVINRYSVAKTFQFKENIRLLKLSMKIARPLIFVCAPPFLFYPMYSLVPAGIGYDGLRYFSVAMYDLWLSVSCVVVIGSLPVYEPVLRQQLCCLRKADNHTRKTQSNVDLTNMYFTMLNNDLEGMSNRKTL